MSFFFCIWSRSLNICGSACCPRSRTVRQSHACFVDWDVKTLRAMPRPLEDNKNVQNVTTPNPTHNPGNTKTARWVAESRSLWFHNSDWEDTVVSSFLWGMIFVSCREVMMVLNSVASWCWQLHNRRQATLTKDGFLSHVRCGTGILHTCSVSVSANAMLFSEPEQVTWSRMTNHWPKENIFEWQNVSCVVSQLMPSPNLTEISVKWN